MRDARKIYKVVGVFDVSPIDAGDGLESFKFRIEVLQELHKARSFHARVYRRETLRVQPTFPLRNGQARGFRADHEVLVRDEALGAETFHATSATRVLEKAQVRIAEVFERKARKKKS